MAEVRSCRFQGGHYLGEISALCLVRLPHCPNFTHLLAGTGSQILLYDVEMGKILNSFHVFEGIRVHGISSSFPDLENFSSSSKYLLKIVVYGERRVKLFDLHFNLLDHQNQREVHAELILVHLLPRFNHWVMDVCFLKDCVPDDHGANSNLAIGLGDNSICLWDIFRSNLVLDIKCPERCLLYSMRLWGDNIKSLHVASGTIYNEVIIWKLVSQRGILPTTSLVENSNNGNDSRDKDTHFRDQQYKAIHLARLSGHEGSILRIAWSSDGSKLISVSDDRSARIWTVNAQKELYGDLWEAPSANVSVGSILFGHNARVWDCYLSDLIIVTAGEDCTCRVWGPNGNQHMMIKEHSGRGIWRCLFDPVSSVLMTAGFDSAIKVYPLHENTFSNSAEPDGVVKEFNNTEEVFSIFTPNISNKYLMDSKSEYVRCMRFAREDMLYIATNHSYLYHVKLSAPEDVKWTELIRVNEEESIICMDLLSISLSNNSSVLDDWIAIGDGKGFVTVVRILFRDRTPYVALSIFWEAERERQLLGIYWCKPLKFGHLFTADPRGRLKLWKLSDGVQCPPDQVIMNPKASLAAEFASCFGTRITCLDASLMGEVLVCGDQRGNILLYTLSEGLLHAPSIDSKELIHPLTYFKAAHGISSVASISVTTINCNQIEICSTGGDGCICYFSYGKQLLGDSRSLDFMGMEQVRELSLIESVGNTTSGSGGCSGQGKYAVGFASADFIIWDLVNEFKILRVPCGGWRRPRSHFLGDAPEIQNCFGFVKDNTIHIHRLWVVNNETRPFPQVLHMQFHGREIHSLCLLAFGSKSKPNGDKDIFTSFSWIATGSEDGTVRLTRYNPIEIGGWSESRLLGEHVGGSAVRSICFVSKIYTSKEFVSNVSHRRQGSRNYSDNTDAPSLLISVGAKQVLTCWLLRNSRPDSEKNAIVDGPPMNTELRKETPSMSFQWLATHMPPKFASTRKRVESMEQNMEVESKATFEDKTENDWRYLAVTAFLVKGADCRSIACFIVVASSDATLTLRALLLPCRLWFDVASLVPQTSPVLGLEHVIVPLFTDKVQIGSIYLVISGSTDGNITFWDLTETIEGFMHLVSVLHPEKLIDCQRRPRTGRGSQGGRWWKELTNQFSETVSKDGNKSSFGEEIKGQANDQVAEGSLPSVHELQPLHVLHSAHQSGVNCLHVSRMEENRAGYPENSESIHYIISGGDDQALHILSFVLVQVTEDDRKHRQSSDTKSPMLDGMVSKSSGLSGKRISPENLDYRLRFLYQDQIPAAHSSAIKGVWTDGSWFFSTGLDQRVRCWHINDHSKLIELAHLVITVPEPETLDARSCGRNRYQIAIAGRGMQMVEFLAPSS